MLKNLLLICCAFLLGGMIQLNAQCADGFTSVEAYNQNTAVDDPIGFQGFGSGFANAFINEMGTTQVRLLADVGTQDFFVGAEIPLGAGLPSTDLSEVFLTADLNIIDAPVGFPVTFDFKVEDASSDAGSGANLLNLAFTIDGPGTFSIGGALSDAINSGFMFNGDAKIVVAFANFGSGPIPGGILIDVTNITLSTCEEGEVMPPSQTCGAGFEQNTLYTQVDAAPTGFGDQFGGGLVNFAIGDNTATIGADAGTADFFVGVEAPAGMELPTMDLSQVYMTADITVDAGAAFNFPINMDFKLEDASSDPGSGANLLNFLTPITENGTFTVGGTLDGASNSGFMFNGAPKVVVALASFGAGPTGDAISVTVSNIQLFTCAEVVVESPCGEGFDESSLYTQADAAPGGFGDQFGGGQVNFTVGENTATIGADAGTADFFVGVAAGTGQTLPTTDLSQVYFTADITVDAGAAFTFPINMDFKLEDASSDAGSGANLLNYLTPLTENGTFTVGGALDAATNTGFMFNGPTTVVVALASFGAGPTTDAISVTISNIQLTACAAISTCDITSVTAVGDAGVCSDSNTYSQSIEVTYIDGPAFGFINVNGNSYPVTGSPQTITFADQVSNGETVDVMVGFSEILTCSATFEGVYTAPASCYEAPAACGDEENEGTIYTQDFEAPEGDPAWFGFAGGAAGNVIGNGGASLFAGSGAQDYFTGVGMPTGAMLPGTDLSQIYFTADVTVEADAGFNFPVTLDFKIEDAASDAGAGANLLNFATPLTQNGTFQVGGTLDMATNTGFQFSGNAVAVAALARFGSANSAGITVTVDNVRINTCMPKLYIDRTGALFGESPAATDGNEIYTWFLNGVQVAEFEGQPFYSPDSLGMYTLIITDPENGVYVFEPYNVTDLNGCCELD